MKIVGAIFGEMKILKFFLLWTNLILRVDRKRKKRARDICERTLDIVFERDRSIGLSSTIGDGQTDRHTFFCKTHF